jgi:selenocysteine lyase/cysteine desulfurase
LRSLRNLTLVDTGPVERSSPLTTFKVRGIANGEAFKRLRQLGHTVKEVLDSEMPAPLNALRVSTHIFNNEDQVDRLLGAIERVVG